jgi:hypothetical protein
MPRLKPPVVSRALSPLELLRLRRQVLRLVCSAPWFDRCWAVLIARRLKPIGRPDLALDYAGLYPPGGAPRPGRPHPTLMRRCKSCGCRWYPPQYVRQCGLCDDCAAADGAAFTDERTHRSSTHSPSAVAFRQLASGRVHLVEPPLPAEDERSLRQEIARHLRQNPAHRSSIASKITKKHDF